MPVYDGTLDEVVGYVMAKDLAALAWERRADRAGRPGPAGPLRARDGPRRWTSLRELQQRRTPAGGGGGRARRHGGAAHAGGPGGGAGGRDPRARPRSRRTLFQREADGAALVRGDAADPRGQPGARPGPAGGERLHHGGRALRGPGRRPAGARERGCTPPTAPSWRCWRPRRAWSGGSGSARRPGPLRPERRARTDRTEWTVTCTSARPERGQSKGGGGYARTRIPLPRPGPSTPRLRRSAQDERTISP